MKSMSKIMVALAVFGLPALSSIAHADQNPATDDVVNLFPYTGTLERDGAAVSGPVEMEFALYDAARGVSGTPIWVETQQVEVYRGRFTALLGLCDQNLAISATCPIGGVNATDIEATVRNADDLALGIRLFPSATSIDLQNRKRFLPVPYAVWTRAATDLEVARDLVVRRDAAVTRNTTVGQDLSVTRNATVGGTLTVTGAVRVGGGGDLSCPNNTRQLHGQCYYMQGNNNLNFNQAAAACATQGGRLCTVAEISALQGTGLHTCTWAWLADRVSNTRGTIAYTNTSSDPGCGGTPGVYSQQVDFTALSYANCCK